MSKDKSKEVQMTVHEATDNLLRRPGLLSHAWRAMEWGLDGILSNTAVSRGLDPVNSSRLPL
jgi:hypothetical protein